MKQEYEHALKQAIVNWEKRANGVTVCTPCPLCLVATRTDECGKCPVNEATKDGCNGTPYCDWLGAQDRYDEKAEKEAAKAEVEFLRSLLP